MTSLWTLLATGLPVWLYGSYEFGKRVAIVQRVRQGEFGGGYVGTVMATEPARYLNPDRIFVETLPAKTVAELGLLGLALLCSSMDP